jgi:hypothetical protein
MGSSDEHCFCVEINSSMSPADGGSEDYLVRLGHHLKLLVLVLLPPLLPTPSYLPEVIDG